MTSSVFGHDFVAPPSYSTTESNMHTVEVSIVCTQNALAQQDISLYGSIGLMPHTGANTRCAAALAGKDLVVPQLCSLDRSLRALHFRMGSPCVDVRSCFSDLESLGTDVGRSGGRQPLVVDVVHIREICVPACGQRCMGGRKDWSARASSYRTPSSSLTETDGLPHKQTVLEGNERKRDGRRGAKHHDRPHVDGEERELHFVDDLPWCLAFENTICAPEHCGQSESIIPV